MRIEALSIRAVTVMIFMMIGVVAIILSLLAGSYFKQAALDAQMSSLSRVIEVASEEMLREVRSHTFNLGMRLGHSREIIEVIQNSEDAGHLQRLTILLDDPFINGFVGFSIINLEKIRVYDTELNLLGESSKGIQSLAKNLSPDLRNTLAAREGTDRLKAIDSLWISPVGPLHSTLVPIGGLRLAGYLEVIINPVFNLPDIGKITKTPISIFSMSGEEIIHGDQQGLSGHLPVEYIMPASDGQPAFRVIGHEDVGRLNAEMEQTKVVTISGFMLLTAGTLLFALWLFNRFLFVPVRHMIRDMQKMAEGKLDLAISKQGLRDFSVLAETFDAMANQVRIRTQDLERLLDMDDSAIVCFGKDNEVVYFNRGAHTLFGYGADEISDLDLRDLFTDDICALMRDSLPPGGQTRIKLRTTLHCSGKDGAVFQRDAVVSPLDMAGGHGYAIVLNALAKDTDDAFTRTVVNTMEKNEQRMNAVEQSLNSLLEMARNAPGLASGATRIDMLGNRAEESTADKTILREHAVQVMHCALACWEHNLDKSKLDLAEESRIWPVYIDKSTPTTRTLDKYLNIESCPKNPRLQRVVDTAEFVLKQMNKKTTNERRQLQQALNDFRRLMSGIKT